MAVTWSTRTPRAAPPRCAWAPETATPTATATATPDAAVVSHTARESAGDGRRARAPAPSRSGSRTERPGSSHDQGNELMPLR